MAKPTTEELDVLRPGFVLVPRVPTSEMLMAGCKALESAADEIIAAELSGAPHAVGRTKMRLRYQAMVEVALKAQERE